MKRLEQVVIVLAGLFLFAISFLKTDLAHGDATIEIKIALWTPAQQALNRDVFVPWSKMLGEKTGGKVKAITYPGQLLAKARDTYEAVLNGTADIGVSHLGLNPGVFKINQIYGLPFLYPTAPVGSRVMMEMYEKEPILRAEFKDVKLLWLMSSTMLRLHTATKPVRRLEDLKGLKIRTGGGPQASVLRALGATPVAISPPDVYTALERGTVDGLTFPWEAVKSYKVDEVTRYHNSASLWGGPFYVIMNSRKWNSLPSDIKKTVTELSGSWASDFASAAWEKEDQSAKEGIRALQGHAIIHFSEKESARWRKATRPIWEGFLSKMEKDGFPAKRILDEIVRTVKKHSK